MDETGFDLVESMLWGEEFAAGAVIDVWNCRAAVSAWVRDESEHYYLKEADNWQELEDEAARAIERMGGAVNISGLYPCPAAIARKAYWSA